MPGLPRIISPAIFAIGGLYKYESKYWIFIRKSNYQKNNINIFMYRINLPNYNVKLKKKIEKCLYRNPVVNIVEHAIMQLR